MAIAVRTDAPTNSLLTLRGPASLSDDLGPFGLEVGPRLAVTRWVKLEEEDWCLRRLLIAMATKSLFSFPLHVERGVPERKQPDYILQAGKNKAWGIEITQAGRGQYHRWLTDTAKALSSNSHAAPFRAGGYSWQTAQRLLVRDVRQAFSAKAATHAKGKYASVSETDLAVYVNSEANEFPGALDLSAAGREAMPEEARARFRRLHLIRGDGGLLVLDLGTPQERVADISRHYDHDFSAWLWAQAAALRGGALDELDRSNIAEELEGLARKDKREVRSHLRVLLLHALKWQFQVSRRSKSWLRSMSNAREKLEDVLADNPSLCDEGFLQAQLLDVYPLVRKRALLETHLPSSTIPNALPFTVGQLLDSEYPMSDDARE